MPLSLSSKSEFLRLAQKGADGYVAWSRNSLPYAYCGGPAEEVMEKLEYALAENGFGKWTNWYNKHTYHCNDGRKEGGGFTDIIGFYGDMPVILTLRFYLEKVTCDVWKLDVDGGIRPGVRLYGIAVHQSLDVTVESFIGNVLKK